MNKKVPFGSEKVIVLPTVDCVVPFTVTDQLVPLGNPVSVNVTVYVTCVKVVATVTGAPFTVELPLYAPDEMCQPGTFAIDHPYVPLGSANAIVEVVELAAAPFNVTDQDVPEGSPVSVNVTAYVTWVKARVGSLTAAPFTVTDPEYGSVV